MEIIRFNTCFEKQNICPRKVQEQFPKTTPHPLLEPSGLPGKCGKVGLASPSRMTDVGFSRFPINSYSNSFNGSAKFKKIKINK